MKHTPVLLKEIVEIFREVPEGYFIDATFGMGGHARALFETYKNKFQIIGIDCDNEIIMEALKELPYQFKIYHRNFRQLPELISREKITPITGILLDLGLNSVHIDHPERGFSFQQEGPLDMRFDRSDGLTGKQVLAAINHLQLEKILREFGEEKKARILAKEIIKNRPRNTQELAAIIKMIIGPKWYIKTAARVFQAIRIIVNDELVNLRIALNGIIPLLQSGGRIAVISYHSLEDGIAKRIFQLYSGKCFCGPNIAICQCGARELIKILTKKPVQPSDEEIQQNPRARSAKLRYAEKI